MKIARYFSLFVAALCILLLPSCHKLTAQQERLGEFVTSMNKSLPLILSPFGIAKMSYDGAQNMVMMDWDYATRQPEVNHYEMVQNVKRVLQTPRLQQLCSLMIPAGADLRISLRTRFDAPDAQPRVVYLSNYDLGQLFTDDLSMPPAVEPVMPETTPEEDIPVNQADENTADDVVQARKDRITEFIIKKNQNLPKLLDDGIWLNGYQTDEEGIELSVNYSIDEYYYDIEAFKDAELWMQMRQAILNDLRRTDAESQKAKELFNRIKVRFVGKSSGEEVDYIVSTTEI